MADFLAELHKRGISLAVLKEVGLGLMAVFDVGLIGWLALKPIRPVTVVVKNDSEKQIVAVRLEHERAVETVESIAKGDARTIKGYQITVTVTDSGIRTNGYLPSRY